MSSNGSGKNLLHLSHNGSTSIIEEEEEVESPGPSKAAPVSDIQVDGDKSTTSIAAQPKDEKSMSYLALTKLGMGKKEGNDAKVETTSDSNQTSEPKAKKTSPKEPKKVKKVKDAEEPKKKSKPMISLLR